MIALRTALARPVTQAVHTLSCCSASCPCGTVLPKPSAGPQPPGCTRLSASTAPASWHHRMRQRLAAIRLHRSVQQHAHVVQLPNRLCKPQPVFRRQRPKLTWGSLKVPVKKPTEANKLIHTHTNR